MIESADSLDLHYREADPWGYDSHPDDGLRRARLLSLLPKRRYARTLDIGCGNGFITQTLPGEEVVGCDVSSAALAWASRRVEAERNRFRFVHAGLFDLLEQDLGTFDLIVVTGVLYPQYVGKSMALCTEILRRVSSEDGIVASCHIMEWNYFRLPFSMIDQTIYPYREYTHSLEIMTS